MDPTSHPPTLTMNQVLIQGEPSTRAANFNKMVPARDIASMFEPGAPLVINAGRRSRKTTELISFARSVVATDCTVCFVTSDTVSYTRMLMPNSGPRRLTPEQPDIDIVNFTHFIRSYARGRTFNDGDWILFDDIMASYEDLTYALMIIRAMHVDVNLVSVGTALRGTFTRSEPNFLPLDINLRYLHKIDSKITISPTEVRFGGEDAQTKDLKWSQWE